MATPTRGTGMPCPKCGAALLLVEKRVVVNESSEPVAFVDEVLIAEPTMQAHEYVPPDEPTWPPLVWRPLVEGENEWLIAGPNITEVDPSDRRVSRTRWVIIKPGTDYRKEPGTWSVWLPQFERKQHGFDSPVTAMIYAEEWIEQFRFFHGVEW